MEATQALSGGGVSGRGRNTGSIALAVIGAILAVVGTLLLYIRVEIIDPDAFADHAVEALKDDQVRDVVSTEIVVQLIERGSPDLVAGRPLLEQVVGTVLGAQPFQQVFRAAARESNRLLFDKGKDNVAFDVSDGLKIVRFALQSINPKLADDLPQSIDLALVKLKERDFARGSLAVADKIRWLGIVGPLIALLVLLGCGAAGARPSSRDHARGAGRWHRRRGDRDRLPDPARPDPRRGDRQRGAHGRRCARGGVRDPRRLRWAALHVGTRARPRRPRGRGRGGGARPGPDHGSGGASPARADAAPREHPRAACARARGHRRRLHLRARLAVRVQRRRAAARRLARLLRRRASCCC